MNYHVFPLFPRDHRDIPYWQAEEEQYPIFAKDLKEVPDWLKAHHQWDPAFDVNKLKKHQLKVKMCCSKCEEIVVEKIRAVRGVFDVRTERWEKKVVVVAMPSGIDEYEVLKKAREVHKKARLVELDAKEKQKVDNKGTKGNKDPGHDDHGHDHNHDGHGQKPKKGPKELQSNPAPSIHGFGWQYYYPWGYPIQTMAPRYYYPAPIPHAQAHPDPLNGQLVTFF